MEEEYYLPKKNEIRLGFKYEYLYASNWIRSQVYPGSIGADLCLIVRNIGHSDTNNIDHVRTKRSWNYDEAGIQLINPIEF